MAFYVRNMGLCEGEGILRKRGSYVLGVRPAVALTISREETGLERRFFPSIANFPEMPAGEVGKSAGDRFCRKPHRPNKHFDWLRRAFVTT